LLTVPPLKEDPMILPDTGCPGTSVYDGSPENKRMLSAIVTYETSRVPEAYPVDAFTVSVPLAEVVGVPETSPVDETITPGGAFVRP